MLKYYPEMAEFMTDNKDDSENDNDSENTNNISAVVEDGMIFHH